MPLAIVGVILTAPLIDDGVPVRVADCRRSSRIITEHTSRTIPS